MSDTVRERILDAIVTAIDAIDTPYAMGKIIDAADPAPDVAATFAAGELIAEITPQSDRTIDAEGERSGWGVEVFRFDVIVVVHVPESLIAAAGKPRRQVATEVHFALYGLYSAKDDPENAGTWGGLALKTKALGGGGYGFSALASDVLAVEHAFEVTYRYTWGDPEEAR